MNNQSYIKPEINKEHPRIKNRTPDQQKYRDDLAQVLKANRQLGDMGSRAARMVLENESESAEYMSAKKNIPEDLAKDILEYISHSEEPEDFSEEPEDLEIDRILGKSKGVSHQKIAEPLIEKGFGYDVVVNLEKFEGLDHKKIAELLIKKEDWFALADNLEKFEGLDSKIAESLIEEGFGYDVADNLEKFEGLDYQKIAELLIEKEDWFTVRVFIHNLKKFEKLDSETVELLIKKVREAEQRKND